MEIDPVIVAGEYLGMKIGCSSYITSKPVEGSARWDFLKSRWLLWGPTNSFLTFVYALIIHWRFIERASIIHWRLVGYFFIMLIVILQLLKVISVPFNGSLRTASWNSHLLKEFEYKLYCCSGGILKKANWIPISFPLNLKQSQSVLTRPCSRRP